MLHITETFGLMEQLANLAMRQWEMFLLNNNCDLVIHLIMNAVKLSNIHKNMY